MKAARQNITLSNIEFHNGMHRGRLDELQQFVYRAQHDPAKKARLEKQECVACFYSGSRIGGATVTTRQCGLCDESLLSGNTNVDVLCVGCARRAQLCRHCGADIDLKNRRKRDIEDRGTVEPEALR